MHKEKHSNTSTPHFSSYALLNMLIKQGIKFVREYVSLVYICMYLRADVIMLEHAVLAKHKEFHF